MKTPPPLLWRTLFFLVASIFSHPLHADEIKVMLLGDSTTKGGHPHLEQTIEQLLASNEGLPKVEIVNVGSGGETCFKLFESGRYEKEVAVVEGVDYLFVRYGINDWFSRKPMGEIFAEDYRKMLVRLREDHPEAQIILMTIIPFLGERATTEVNTVIAKLAMEEELPLFDIHPAYKKGLEEHGRYSMNTRFFAFKNVPDHLKKIVKPLANYVEWKKGEYVRVDSTELDPLLGHLPGWYSDAHPNTMGYNLIAREMARYLEALAEERASR